MQWSPDRNGGFSKADPARLVLPPIQDPLDGFQAVNVEAQSRSPNSLLNWMRRMLAVRRRTRAFGRGQMNLLYPANRKVLAYLREHGMPQHPADLQQHRAVNYASPTTARVEPWEWQDGGQLRTLPMPGWVRVNSAEASIACCVAGLGLLQIPRYDVQAELQSGALVEVMPQYAAQPLPVTLLQPHRQHRALRVQVFVEWLLPVLRIGLQLQ